MSIFALIDLVLQIIFCRPLDHKTLKTIILNHNITISLLVFWWREIIRPIWLSHRYKSSQSLNSSRNLDDGLFCHDKISFTCLGGSISFMNEKRDDSSFPLTKMLQYSYLASLLFLSLDFSFRLIIQINQSTLSVQHKCSFVTAILWAY